MNKNENFRCFITKCCWLTLIISKKDILFFNNNIKYYILCTASDARPTK